MNATEAKNEGRRRKQEAQEGHRHRNPLFTRTCERAILFNMLVNGGRATIDDVRAVVPTPPGKNPTIFGGVFRALCMAGLIAHDGFACTKRPEGHARPVRVWRLVDKEAAIAWLAANPAPGEPAKPMEKLPQDSKARDQAGHTEPSLFDFAATQGGDHEANRV